MQVGASPMEDSTRSTPIVKMDTQAEKACKEDREECAICLEPVPQDRRALVEACCHVFCEPCLRTWVGRCVKELRKPRCPLCKGDATSYKYAIKGEDDFKLFRAPQIIELPQPGADAFPAGYLQHLLGNLNDLQPWEPAAEGIALMAAISTLREGALPPFPPPLARAAVDNSGRGRATLDAGPAGPPLPPHHQAAAALGRARVFPALARVGFHRQLAEATEGSLGRSAGERLRAPAGGALRRPRAADDPAPRARRRAASPAEEVAEFREDAPPSWRWAQAAAAHLPFSGLWQLDDSEGHDDEDPPPLPAPRDPAHDNNTRSPGFFEGWDGPPNLSPEHLRSEPSDAFQLGELQPLPLRVHEAHETAENPPEAENPVLSSMRGRPRLGLLDLLDEATSRPVRRQRATGRHGGNQEDGFQTRSAASTEAQLVGRRNRSAGALDAGADAPRPPRWRLRSEHATEAPAAEQAPAPRPPSVRVTRSSRGFQPILPAAADAPNAAATRIPPRPIIPRFHGAGTLPSSSPSPTASAGVNALPARSPAPSAPDGGGGLVPVRTRSYLLYRGDTAGLSAALHEVAAAGAVPRQLALFRIVRRPVPEAPARAPPSTSREEPNLTVRPSINRTRRATDSVRARVSRIPPRATTPGAPAPPEGGPTGPLAPCAATAGATALRGLRARPPRLGSNIPRKRRRDEGSSRPMPVPVTPEVIDLVSSDDEDGPL